MVYFRYKSKEDKEEKDWNYLNFAYDESSIDNVDDVIVIEDMLKDLSKEIEHKYGDDYAVIGEFVKELPTDVLLKFLLISKNNLQSAQADVEYFQKMLDKRATW